MEQSSGMPQNIHHFLIGYDLTWLVRERLAAHVGQYRTKIEFWVIKYTPCSIRFMNDEKQSLGLTISNEVERGWRIQYTYVGAIHHSSFP